MQNRYQLVVDETEELISSYFIWGISTALNVMYAVRETDGSTHFYIYKRHYERSSAYMSPFFELSNPYKNMEDAYAAEPADDWEIIALDAYHDTDLKEQTAFIITQ